jgi:hypothetical protein
MKLSNLLNSYKSMAIAGTLLMASSAYIYDKGHSMPQRALQKHAPQAALVMQLQEEQSQALATVIGYQLNEQYKNIPLQKIPELRDAKNELSRLELQIAQYNTLSSRIQAEQAYNQGKTAQAIAYTTGTSGTLCGIGMLGLGLCGLYRTKKEQAEHEERFRKAKPLN